MPDSTCNLLLNKKELKSVKEELKEEVTKLKEEGIVPCLAVVQVGKDPASSVYVNNKKRHVRLSE